jgi:hypothetical protein
MNAGFEIHSVLIMGLLGPFHVATIRITMAKHPPALFKARGTFSFSAAYRGPRLSWPYAFST